MTLRNPEPPAGHAAALARRLSDVVQTATGSAFLGWDYESPPRPRGLEPHAVHHVGRDTIAAGRLLPEVGPPDAWRTLLQLDGEEVFAMDLGAGAEDLPLLALAKGPVGRLIHEAVRRADEQESGRADEVELRILSVPALQFEAVWLTAARGDSLVPLRSHPGGLTAGEHHTPEEVLAVLQAEVERLVAFERELGEAAAETN